MGPKQAWIVFSFVALVADVSIAIGLIDLGYPQYPVALLAVLAAVIYFYIVYKRYHVEVVPESDIEQFDDIDDLRILSGIYGLDTDGTESDIRERLSEFARRNEDNAFVWVAPRSVISVGSALEVPKGPSTAASPSAKPASVATTKTLVGGRRRSPQRLDTLMACPICESRVAKSTTICGECGADMEFYSVLSESKVGRRLISEKASGVRRKLRYEVPLLGDNR